MYPILFVCVSHISCLLAVSKSARFDNHAALWAWVVSNLVLTSSIYAPVVSGKKALFLLHWALPCLSLINLLYVIFLGGEEWLSIDPYVTVISTSFATDYYHSVLPSASR